MLDLLRLKIKGYIIIDDFLPNEICDKLRYFALNDKKVDYQWSNYVAKNFDDGDDPYSLKWVADQYISQRVSFVKKESYIRSWSFLYNNKRGGVGPHIDPGSYYTFNIWVTPDDCVEDNKGNGLRIYRKRFDKVNYGGIVGKEFVKGEKYDIIPYRYNRCVIYRGNTIHETDCVSMKSGSENKRISYTFLYDG